MTYIGAKIKAVRVHKGLSQEFMAQKIGITQSTYQRIEVGNAKPSDERLEKIATIFDLSVQELMNWSQVEDQVVERITELERRLNLLENRNEQLWEILQYLYTVIPFKDIIDSIIRGLADSEGKLPNPIPEEKVLKGFLVHKTIIALLDNKLITKNEAKLTVEKILMDRAFDSML